MYICNAHGPACPRSWVSCNVIQCDFMYVCMRKGDCSMWYPRHTNGPARLSLRTVQRDWHFSWMAAAVGWRAPHPRWLSRGPLVAKPPHYTKQRIQTTWQTNERTNQPTIKQTSKYTNTQTKYFKFSQRPCPCRFSDITERTTNNIWVKTCN